MSLRPIFFVSASCSALLACTQLLPPVPKEEAPVVKEEPQEAIDLEQVLTFEVVAPGEHPLLSAYAAATGLSAKPANDGGVALGPLLSRFEAAFVAGLVPKSTVRLTEEFLEPASLEPFRRFANGRDPTLAMLRGAYNERFALVTWQKSDGATEKELFQTHPSGPRFVLKLPDTPTLEGPASGLVYVRQEPEGAILQLATSPQKGALRRERLVAWRSAGEGRASIFERESLSLSEVPPQVPAVSPAAAAAEPAAPKTSDPAPPKAADAAAGKAAASTAPKKAPTSEPMPNALTLSVTRLVPGRGTVELVTYDLTLRPLPGAAGVMLVLNDWSSPRWKDIPTPPALVEIASAVEKKRETLSLE